MSKWLKLLNQAEQMQLNHPIETAVRASDHHESEAIVHHGISSRLYMVALTVITAVALCMSYKMTVALKMSQAERGTMTANYNQQQERLKSIEQEVLVMKVDGIDKLQGEVIKKQGQLEQLSIENDLLKIKVNEMEYSQQQMIDEIETLSQDTTQNSILTEGRKI